MSENNHSSGIWRVFNRTWRRIPLTRNFRWNIEDTILPEDISERLLPDEEPEIEIRLAWYRDMLGRFVGRHFWWIFLATIITAVALYLSPIGGGNLLVAAIPFLILFILLVEATREYIEYSQWRILKTNLRLIISMPQPGAWPLIDNIEMKGTPRVIDTNWSRNPFWRVFQFFTGARDVYISLTAFKFVQGTARVDDALVIPDIMPRDVYELKALVFRK